MSSDQVIELSVEETNDLRRKLGLAPLRGVSGDNKKPAPAQAGGGDPKAEQQVGAPDEVVLELSVSATNDLRRELGLPPLRTGAAESSSKSVIHHAPAVNVGEAHEAEERIERAKLKRQVEQNLHEQFAPTSLADEEAEGDANHNTIKTWAQKMRHKGSAATTASTATASMQQPPPGPQSSVSAADHVVGSGLHVAHRRSDFETGTTTTLTLADAPILEIDSHRQIVGLASGGDGNGDGNDGAVLENVNLADAARLHDGLKTKRQLELGAGRAGAYAGFDDDEFEELGGTQAPSRQTRGGGGGAAIAKGSHSTDPTPKRPKSYFQIGALQEEEEEAKESAASDLFAAQQGKAVSLEPARADVIASDFLTAEEDREANTMRKTSKSKKEAKFKTKKEKKKSKKHKRKIVESDDDEDEETTVRVPIRGAKALLDDLEETAVGALESGAARKRRRRDSEDVEDAREVSPVDGSGNDAMEVEESALAGKRAKFDAIMAKANERTKKAFQTITLKPGPMVDADDEPDDAFLNAALSKARRIGRLKELAKPTANAAETVAAAVLASADRQAAAERVLGQGGAAGTVDFVVDEASEFTRALQSRTEQRQRQALKKKESDAQPSNVISTTRIKMEEAEDDDDKDVNMEEMAQEIQPDREDLAVGSAAALDGATGATVRLGRGLGGVLGLLQQTGELTRKNAGKEELRGRAKDERHYEDYQPLDLSQVVKIDERTATDKDKDLAHRQIKLEYRDKHGRLLTRKEAFRELSYQFHGYGSGKRKEEKKMVQIAREQAEARASQSVGTLGALQATQKATGKAFVVHKT